MKKILLLLIIFCSLKINAQLYHYYKLDSNANDSFGSVNGTAANVTWDYGCVNNAFKGNGTSSKISFSNTLTPSGSVTFNFLIRTTSTAADCCFFNNGGYTAGKTGFYIATNGSPYYSVYVTCGRGTLGTWNFQLNGTKDVHDGKWHMITITWTGDATSNGAKLYIDKILQAQASALSTIGTPSENATISNYFTSYGWVNGWIDDFRIYNSVLSNADFSNLFTNYKGQF